jgi:hypothetical protein
MSESFTRYWICKQCKEQCVVISPMSYEAAVPSTDKCSNPLDRYWYCQFEEFVTAESSPIVDLETYQKVRLQYLQNLIKRIPEDEKNKWAVSKRTELLQAIEEISFELNPTYVVRLYDMFDGWIDVTHKPLTMTEALEVWNEKTNYGAQKVKYSDGDYYKIFPSNTRMIQTPEFRGR